MEVLELNVGNINIFIFDINLTKSTYHFKILFLVVVVLLLPYCSIYVPNT
jgi:hypothetical protein